MLTPRGVAVALTGVAMWLAARLVGSPGLEVVAIGLATLPFAAALFIRFRREPLTVRRHLSEPRVMPGTRVSVELELRNANPSTTSFLLLEDRVPPPLGRPARLVIADVPGRGTRVVSYTVVPRLRGRYAIGPLTVDRTDAFGLCRARTEVPGREQLIVTPQIEDLTRPVESGTAPSVGVARSRQLMRTGEDYYTMRGYQEGDDLRRIHWPSVARTGDLMIRQDEASRRASAVLFVDNREAGLGRDHTPAFERMVSCAASVGALLSAEGFALRLGTDLAPVQSYTLEGFLDALAGVRATESRTLSRGLDHLRAGGGADRSLIFVGAPPSSGELATLGRIGSAYGPKLAILVHPTDPGTAPGGRGPELEQRATRALLALTRQRWDCLVLSPGTDLRERWHVVQERPLASNA